MKPATPMILIEGVPHWRCKTCRKPFPRSGFYGTTAVDRGTNCRTCHLDYCNAIRRAKAAAKAAARASATLKEPVAKPHAFHATDDTAYHQLLLDMHDLAEAQKKTFREVMTEALTKYLARAHRQAVPA